MTLTRSAAAAASLLLSACGLDTFGLSDGSTVTTTTIGGSTAPTDGLDTAGPTEGSAGATTMSSTAPPEPFPETSTLQLSFSQVKQFDFTWSAAGGADYYKLLERPTPGDDYLPFEENIVGTSFSLSRPLHLRFGASYRLRACNTGGCGADSPAVHVVDSMADAVGYFKASNTDPEDNFGRNVALSADGNTLVVGATLEDSGSPIDGDQSDNAVMNAGAAYVFVRENDTWSQQAYLKAFKPGAGDNFGAHLAVSANGDTLVIGAPGEDGFADVLDSGAAYVFVRVDGAWSQQAYLKASNTSAGDNFGASVAISADGYTLAVGAPEEDSSGIGGNQADNSVVAAGAVYIFERAENNAWPQKAYLKASPAGSDYFGYSLALSAKGDTLAVGASVEDSSASGVNGDQHDNSASAAGAVYVFVRPNNIWSQQAYLKASNTDVSDLFGYSVALSAKGDTLAVGASFESSQATGIDGDQDDNSAAFAGAVYLFVRTSDTWSQQAYIKASNSAEGHIFGGAVALSADGHTLAVGAANETGTAAGVGGEQTDNPAPAVGAAYVFVRSGTDWSQRGYVKASNSGSDDIFGLSLALSGDGKILAVGAFAEDSASEGIGGDQADNSAIDAGAVYLY